MEWMFAIAIPAMGLVGYLFGRRDGRFLANHMWVRISDCHMHAMFKHYHSDGKKEDWKATFINSIAPEAESMLEDKFGITRTDVICGVLPPDGE